MSLFSFQGARQRNSHLLRGFWKNNLAYSSFFSSPQKPQVGFRGPHNLRVLCICSSEAKGFNEQNGGDNRDRTDDPLLAKQVLSQLSYTPSSKILVSASQLPKNFLC